MTSNSVHPKKTLLVDADGVLFDWEQPFNQWMERYGFVQQPGNENQYSISLRYGIGLDQSHQLIRLFNESANIGFLPGLRDAVYYVRLLHEHHGYVFHCITSLSSNPYAQTLREMNLRNLFGKNVFEKIICLDTGADKDRALKFYAGSGCYWVEDKPENARVGKSLGLRPLLMEHEHNKNDSAQLPVVKNWREIYEIVTS